MRVFKFFGMIFLVILLSACTASIVIDSEPQGADVTVNGRKFGKTPTNPIRLSTDYPIKVEKYGYETYEGVLSPFEMSPFLVRLDKKDNVSAGTTIITVTNDGSNITTKREEVHAETNVIERSPNVKAVRRITNLSEVAWLGSFNLSSDGKNVVLEVYEEEIGEGKDQKFSNLWSANAKSPGPLRRITQGKYFDQDPSFANGNNDIYFASNRLDSFDIWKLSFFSGSGLSLKTNSPSMQEFKPSVTGDGKTLLFSSFMRGSKIKQIWSLNQKNGELIQLREGQWPKWFDKNNKIIFSALQRTTGEWKIWTMGDNGSSPIQISTTDGSNDIHASVSPSGKKVVFASDRASVEGKKNYDIWMSDIDGNNLVQLTTNGSRDDSPVFSPDGKTIYFRSNRGVKWDVWAMDLDI